MKIRVLMSASCIVMTVLLSSAPAADMTTTQPASEIERLIGDGQAPAISEDGARVAYVDQAYRIWVVERDGSGRRQLTSGHYDLNPAFSPDGNKIAFRRSSLADGSNYSNIWIMNVDGSGQAPLTDARTTGGYYDRPSWSPDGTMLAMEAAVHGMMSEIYVMDLASRRFVNATRMNTGQNNRFDHQSPVWLADGDRIATIRNDELVILNLQPVLARLNQNPSRPRPAAFIAAVGAH